MKEPLPDVPKIPFFHWDTSNLLLATLVLTFLLMNIVFFRVVHVLSRKKPENPIRRPRASSTHPTHLLVVLGSGGHTAEMLNMLRNAPDLSSKFTHRTYVVSSGDGFSAQRAAEFESEVFKNLGSFHVTTVSRARKVHQSIFTTPWSATMSLWDCVKVVRGRHPDQQLDQSNHVYPDLILTNGPGTGVCVVLASIICLCLGFSGPRKNANGQSDKAEEAPYEKSGQMRTIFIESWARVRSLSLSGKILLPLVDRFLVQWPKLVAEGSRAEYVGTLFT
jgi:beta-1,4-N-acetylglucosaminyltransferase